jgi:outer membrane lipoprotein-sorting protein
MGTITTWVRRAQAATLAAVGAAAVVVFVAANWLATVDTSPPHPPRPTTLDELTLRELGGPGPAGVTARFSYVDGLVPTSGLVPQATSGGSTLPLVAGADGRLWYSHGRLRMEFQTPQGDTQLVYDHGHVLVYDAADGTAYSAVLPILPIPDLSGGGVSGAAALLQRLAGAATVTGPTPIVTAGRPAYSVRIAPTRNRGLFRAATLAVDARTGTPLRIDLYAVGSSGALVELALSDVSYGAVDPSVFRVRLPFGMRPLPIRFQTPPTLGAVIACHAPAELAGMPLATCREAVKRNEVPGRILVYGHGLDSVAVLEQPETGDSTGGLWELLPTITVGSSSGRELVTAMGTVIRFGRGGITYTAIGSVPRSVVETVARGL